MRRTLYLLLLCISALPAAITRVNYTTTNNVYMNATPVSSFQTESPGITVQNGALLIGCARSSVPITGLSDGGSNTFTSIVQELNGAASAYVHCFYKENAVGGSNLRFTFTVSSGTYNGGMVAQYTGIETASSLDLYRTALTTTGTLTTTSFTTAQANELVFSYTDVAQFATTWSATSPLTLIAQSDQNVLAFSEEFAVTQLTGVTRSMTNTDVTYSKVMILMTFKGSAAPPVTPHRPAIMVAKCDYPKIRIPINSFEVPDNDFLLIIRNGVIQTYGQDYYVEGTSFIFDPPVIKVEDLISFIYMKEDVDQKIPPSGRRAYSCRGKDFVIQSN